MLFRSQSAAWFTSVLRTLGDAVHEPDAVILVHCHMGVNRGPSMAHRILLEQGWDAVDALAAIREARPIANVEYVTDSVRHFHGRTSDSFTPLRADLDRVRAWRAERPLDLSWIISRIRRAA